MFVFAGALAVSVRQPEAANALLQFLASPEASAAILKAGLMPPADR
jgi:ABC-type glycerol-3-phosphate transport system substrate-binding protein